MPTLISSMPRNELTMTGMVLNRISGRLLNTDSTIRAGARTTSSINLTTFLGHFLDRCLLKPDNDTLGTIFLLQAAATLSSKRSG